VVNPSALHHQPHAAQRFDVARRIAIDGDEMSTYVSIQMTLEQTSASDDSRHANRFAALAPTLPNRESRQAHQA
jgi:hypothetical protein